jgi:acetoin utilization deacetylase AcuC-like enzyme
MKVATYFHSETCNTTIPREQIEFVGQSLPYYDEVRAKIQNQLKYPVLELCRTSIDNYKTVHANKYVDSITALSAGQDVEHPKLSAECSNLYYAVPGYEHSLGGVFKAIDLMKNGELDRAYCFSLPSHHGFREKGHGYCLLNTEAAAVRYAQSVGFKNVLVIDWDIHHGDGTQTIFEYDPSVYCISIHSAVDLYMSIMKSIELGTTTYAEKVGHCNIPVLSEEYTDDFYFFELGLPGLIFRSNQIHEQFELALGKLSFSPDLIVIFDGHDSHIKDCGEGITEFQYEDFRVLTKAVKNIADKVKCPILSMPGGGYNLDITVQAALIHVEELFKE